MNVFLIEDNELLKKCNTTWDKVSADVKKNFTANLSITKKFKNQNKI